MSAEQDDRLRSRLVGGLIALAILLIPALLFAWFGGLVAGKVVAPGYRDSLDIVYLAIGGLAAFMASLFSLGAVVALRLVAGWQRLRIGSVWLLAVLLPFIGGGVTAFLFSL